MNRRNDPTRCPSCGRKYKTTNDQGAKKESGPAAIRLSTLGIIALAVILIWAVSQMVKSRGEGNYNYSQSNEGFGVQ